jgi:hypothetical protein
VAEKKLYGAGFGPYLYDDTDPIDDPDGDFSTFSMYASISDGGHLCDFVDLFDTDQSNALTLVWNEDDNADRVLNLLVSGGNRSLTVEDDSIVNQDLTTDADVEFNSVTLAADEYANFGGVYGTSGYGFRDNSGIMEVKNSGDAWIPLPTASSASWAIRSPAGSTGTFYYGGFYRLGSTNSTFVAPVSFGTANVAYAGHAFAVLGEATVDELTIRVSGTSINDQGSTTASDTEDIVIPTSISPNAYYETAKKWLGQIVFTYISGTAKNCNYGIVKYWDNNNSNFQLVGLEVTWLGGANDANPDIKLRHHKSTGWTYNAGAAPTPPTALASMATDYGTKKQIANNQNGAWKRDNLSTTILGGDSEGILFSVTTTANNAFANGNISLIFRQG